jgi:MerR family transcriptional regulator/heat shock protein HspR
MESNRFFSIEEVSAFCDVAIDILQEWAEDGLFSVRFQGKTEGVESAELREIKRIVDLYKTLGVNMEGVEIIITMRNRIREMDRQMQLLQRRLDRLEEEHNLRSLEIPRAMGLLIDYFEDRE